MMAITVFNNSDPQRDLTPFATTLLALLAEHAPKRRIRKRIRKQIARIERPTHSRRGR